MGVQDPDAMAGNSAKVSVACPACRRAMHEAVAREAVLLVCELCQSGYLIPLDAPRQAWPANVRHQSARFYARSDERNAQGHSSASRDYARTPRGEALTWSTRR